MNTRNVFKPQFSQTIFNILTLLALVFGVAGLSVRPVDAANFTVTKTTDTADGACDADCSLREAIIAANATAEADTIALGVGTYMLSRVGTDDTANLGDLDVTKPLTITGQGAAQTIIDANHIDRVFDMRLNAGTIVFSDLTITGGTSASYCGGLNSSSGVNLTLVNVNVRNNQAATVGGGVCGTGILSLQNSQVSSNTAGTYGGGMYVGNGQVTLLATDILSNTATSSGGGIYVSADTSKVTHTGPGEISLNHASSGGAIYLDEGDAYLTGVSLLSNDVGTYGLGGGVFVNQETALFSLINGSISQNHSSDGAGIYINNGAATLEQVAVTNNNAGNIGGGVYNGYGNLALTNVTVSGNHAQVSTSLGGGGGGLFLGGSSIYSSQSELIFTTITNNTTATGSGGNPGAGGIHFANGDANLQNVIIANNSNDVDLANCVGTNLGISLITSYGNNLESSDTCGLTESGDQTNSDPLLEVLTPDGVHPLQAISPAIDSGVCLPGIDIDQRGLSRPQGVGCDIGAYEVAEAAPVGLSSVSISGSHTGETGVAYAFTAAVTPIDAAQPVTYTWSPEPASGQGTASVIYDWSTPGTKEISVTAQNQVNTVGSEIFSITINEWIHPDFQICLPLVIR